MGWHDFFKKSIIPVVIGGIFSWYLMDSNSFPRGDIAEVPVSQLDTTKISVGGSIAGPFVYVFNGFSLKEKYMFEHGGRNYSVNHRNFSNLELTCKDTVIVERGFFFDYKISKK